ARRPARLAAQYRAHLRAVPDPARAPRPARRHAFGRRAADAGDRPRHRLVTAPAEARRAIHGAGTGGGWSHLRAHRRAAPRRAHHPAGRAARRRSGAGLRFRLCSGDRTRRPVGLAPDPACRRSDQERLSRNVMIGRKQMSRRHLLLSASALAATTLAALALLPVPAATQTQEIKVALIAPLSGPRARQGYLV